MADHKTQHFIPQSYLRAWCDQNTPEGQEPYVWLFSSDGSNPRRKAPHNIFHETDLYTIKLPGGGRDLVLEHGLAQLESEFVSIRDTKLRSLEPLEPAEHALLCAFVAAMHARTPARRDHFAEQWGKVLAMADQMMEWEKTATLEQKLAAASLSPPNQERSLTYGEVKALAEKPLQTSMVLFIKEEAQLLTQLDFAVFTCNNGIGFITSDNPCVWSDPEAYKRPPYYQTPALMYESIEITLPVSPHQIVLLNRRGVSGYIPAPEKWVDELNRRTRFNCTEYFVSNTNTTRPLWFDPGTEPDVSWKKRNPDAPK
ncbi:MAG: DUF4238 domain-containing protein [candidate division NC10 bacterium]|nr:DUF4238 domain-containing protein [candidate division NC10 bacterium]